MSGGLILAKRGPSGMENPPAGKVRLFVNDDGQLCAMDETGQIVAPEELVSSVEAALSTEASARGAAEATLTAAAAAAKTTADAALPKAGGTMTGDIVLKGDPTANLHPATKQYVAAQIANVIAGAPGALDTLKEISDQLANDESAVGALTTTVAGKESSSNKDTSTSLGASDTKYPSQKAVKGYVDTAVGLLVPSSSLDTDTTFAANSDSRIATQKAAKSYTEGAVASIGRRLLRKLTENLEDCSILIIGDSTSQEYTSWPGKVFEGLAARFPAYTFKYRNWTDGEAAYNAASTKQAGSGERTITMYNCAVGGKNAQYQMAPNFDAMIGQIQPDLIFWSHGHNHGNSSYPPEPAFRDAMTVVTESITRACPSSELVVFAQNPRTDANKEVHAKRQFVAEEIAQRRGFGFINMHRLFLDTDPTAVSLLNEDGIHPNSTGYTLMATEVLRKLNLSGRLASQQPSGFTVPAATLLVNPAFETFASPPTLTGWTATNALLEKNTTNYESVAGWSVRMTTVSEASEALLFQNVTNNALRTLRGGWVNFAARIRVPANQTGEAGRLSINENNGSHAGSTANDNLTDAEGHGYGQGDFRWAMVSRRIAADCTSVSFVIKCSPAGKSGDVSIDRVAVARGILPKDIRT